MCSLLLSVVYSAVQVSDSTRSDLISHLTDTLTDTKKLFAPLPWEFTRHSVRIPPTIRGMGVLGEDSKGFGALLIGVIFLYVGVWAVTATYNYIDESGYISHTEQTIITAKNNWMVGETRACSSVPLGKDLAKTMKKPTGYVAAMVVCDEDEQRLMTVTFKGKMEQPEQAMVRWNCTRKSESFVCEQVKPQ